jgi:hypothetical protein
MRPWNRLGDAITDAWNKIKAPIEHIAGKINRYFVGHSPIPEGPSHGWDFGRPSPIR